MARTLRRKMTRILEWEECDGTRWKDDAGTKWQEAGVQRHGHVDAQHDEGEVRVGDACGCDSGEADQSGQWQETVVEAVMMIVSEKNIMAKVVVKRCGSNGEDNHKNQNKLSCARQREVQRRMRPEQKNSVIIKEVNSSSDA